MTLVEGLLVTIALSMNVFLIAEYEGSCLKILNGKRLLLISLIFFVGQMISMGLGYLVTTIPFFHRGSTDMTAFCYVLAAIIFLIIGGWMFYKAIKRNDQDEHLRELQYRRVVVEAALMAILTFIVGIGCGFLGANVVNVFICVAFITIAAVVSGLYCGYYQGFRFRQITYGVSCAVFIGTGIEVLVRYV